MTFADDAMSAIQQRIATLPTWTAEIDDSEKNTVNVAKLALIFDKGDAVLFTTNSYLGRELSISILVSVKYEAVGPGDPGPESHRRQCLGELHDVLFGAPFVLDGDWDLLDDGWSALPADESNLARAVMNLRYRYKQDIGNSSAFTGATT